MIRGLLVQIDAQKFIPVVEAAGQIAFVDLESTGTKGDYNSILVVSIKPWHGRAKSFVVDRPGNDRSILKAVRDELEKYTVWVTYYGKGFDIPMIQSRLLVNRLKPLEKRHHIDMYFVLKYRILTGRRSQAHLLEWLNAKQKKMTLSPDVWVQVIRNPDRWLPKLKSRCESDVAGLEALYDESKLLIGEITR